jgi:hypothetical protein
MIAVTVRLLGQDLRECCADDNAHQQGCTTPARMHDGVLACMSHHTLAQCQGAFEECNRIEDAGESRSLAA